jgi:hypothetical protein
MAKNIDYKKQLEILKDITDGFFADKLISNAFTEFEKGHQTAIRELNDGIRILIKRALKGKLQDD